MALTPRTTKVDILQGEDNERLADLSQDLQIAQQAHAQVKVSGSPSRVGDELPSLSAARDALKVFAEEAADRAVTVRLRAIGRGRFRDLRREHEPRKVKRTVDGNEVEEIDERDDQWGVNTDTFPEALLRYRDTSDPETRTILEPEFGTTKELQRFLDDELAEGDFVKLWTSAFLLNAEPGNDPKVVTAYAAHQMLDETSE